MEDRGQIGKCAGADGHHGDHHHQAAHVTMKTTQGGGGRGGREGGVVVVDDEQTMMMMMAMMLLSLETEYNNATAVKSRDHDLDPEDLVSVLGRFVSLLTDAFKSCSPSPLLPQHSPALAFGSHALVTAPIADTMNRQHRLVHFLNHRLLKKPKQLFKSLTDNFNAKKTEHMLQVILRMEIEASVPSPDFKSRKRRLAEIAALLFGISFLFDVDSDIVVTTPTLSRPSPSIPPADSTATTFTNADASVASVAPADASADADAALEPPHAVHPVTFPNFLLSTLCIWYGNRIPGFLGEIYDKLGLTIPPTLNNLRENSSQLLSSSLSASASTSTSSAISSIPTTSAGALSLEIGRRHDQDYAIDPFAFSDDDDDNDDKDEDESHCFESSTSRDGLSPSGSIRYLKRKARNSDFSLVRALQQQQQQQQQPPSPSVNQRKQQVKNMLLNGTLDSPSQIKHFTMGFATTKALFRTIKRRNRSHQRKHTGRSTTITTPSSSTTSTTSKINNADDQNNHPPQSPQTPSRPAKKMMGALGVSRIAVK